MKLKMVGLSAVVLVLQLSSAFGQITIDPPTRTAPKEGGGYSILTAGSGTWTASTAASWITITPRTNGTAGESCIYVVSANFSADTRQGVIAIGGNNHTVTQTGYDATLTPQSATYGIAGGTGSIAVATAAGVSWSAASTTSWITVHTTNGIANGTVLYSVAPYGGVVTRVGSLLVGSKTFLVTQTGTDVNISPSAVDKAYSSDIIQVSVTALVGTLWTVVANNPWITVVDPGNGFGDSVITLAIGTNPSYAPRVGTVSIGSATFTIRQDGARNPSLDITPYSSTADPNGALGNIAVSATPDSPWNSQSQNGWIIIASGTNGSGNGNISYVVSANPTISTRVGTIAVTGPAPNDSNNDFARGLMHCYSGRTDVVSYNSSIQGANYPDFVGTNTAFPYINLTQAILKDTEDWSIAFSVRHHQDGTVHRLLYLGDKLGVWIDAQYHLNVKVNAQTVTVNTLDFRANTNYFVILQGGTNSVDVYACRLGDVPVWRTQTAGSSNILPARADFSGLTMGGGAYPSSGFYTGRFELKSIHARKLTAAEIENYQQSTPYNIATTEVSRAFWVTRGSSTLKPVRNVLFRGCARNENGTGNYELLLSNRYSLITGGYTWSAANSDANAKGGRLAIIRSQEDQNLAALTAGGNQAWLGATDTSSEGTWRWVDGSSISYANWSPGEPNGTPSDSDYMVMYPNGKWDDQPQTGPYSYISEYIGVPGFMLTQDRFNRQASAMVLTNRSGGRYFSVPFNTALFWVKQDGVAGGIISAFRAPSAAGDNHFAFGINASTKKLYLQQDNGALQTFETTFDSGQWRQISITISSSYNIKVFVDGTEVGNVLPYRSLSGVFTDFGLRTWQTPTMVGAFDDLGLYTNELTSAEILGLYNAQKPIRLTHTVTQGALPVSLTPAQSVVSANGGTAELNLALGGNVSWTTTVGAAWLSLNTNSGAGPTTLVVQAAANGAVTSRTGTVTAGGQTVQILQEGRWATVSTNNAVIGPDGGSLYFDVSAEGAATWTATRISSWLTIALGASGSGNGSVMVVADPYNEYSRARIGTVEIAGYTVYVSQCGYALTVNPTGVQIGSNAGAGELAIVAPLDAVWEAVVTAPWITLIGGNNGIGSGTLRYSVTDNLTGSNRTGRIIISGVQYTIVQGPNPTDNDQDGMPNDWELFYGFNIDDPADASGDPDDDKLTNLREYQLGTNPLLRDTSGDGVDDGTAYALANLGFSPTDDSSALLQQIQAQRTGLGLGDANDVLDNPNAYGLYNSNQMHGLALGDLVIDRNPSNNRFRVGFGLQTSSNMLDWLPMPDQNIAVSVSNGLINTEVTTDTNAWFFRVRSGTQP